MMTFNSLTTSSNPLFIELKLLKLNDIYNLKVGLAMRQMVREKSLATYDISLISTSHHYSTRSSSKYNCFIPFVRTNIGKSLIKYQGPIIWNSIPKEIKNLSHQAFKINFKNHLLNSYSLQ